MSAAPRKYIKIADPQPATVPQRGPQDSKPMAFDSMQDRRAWLEDFLERVELDRFGELRDIKKETMDNTALDAIVKHWGKTDDLRSYGRMSWDQDRDVSAARNADLIKIRALCMSKYLPWDFFGLLLTCQPDDALFTKMVSENSSLPKSEMLRYLIHADNAKKPERIRFLLQNAATVDEYNFRREILPKFDDNVIDMIMDYCLSAKVLRDALYEAAREGKQDLFLKASAILQRRAGAQVIDDTTLMTVKYVPDYFTGAGALKTVFDFHAQRVQEIFVPDIKKEGNTTMVPTDMEKYGREALETARKTLEKLTGKPVPDLPNGGRRTRRGLGNGGIA